MFDRVNPYASSPADAQRVTVFTTDGITARLTRSGWVYREIELTGEIQATIVYDGKGLGYESVLVNGQVAAQSKYTGWQHLMTYLCPEILFDLDIDGGPTIPARVEVRSTFYASLAALRLWIGNSLVYSEGRWR